MRDPGDELDQSMADAVRRYAKRADTTVDHAQIARRAMSTPSSPRMSWRLGGGIASVAAAAVVLIAVVLAGGFRPSTAVVPIGGASPTGPAVTAALPSGDTASPSSGVSSAIPSATAPSPLPSAPSGSPVLPSASASPVESASAQPSAEPSAAPSLVPSPSTVTAHPVPGDFAPVSVTFVSADEGFVLGSVPCAAAACPAIAHTVDAGLTWSLLAGAPATSIAVRQGSDSGTAGISSLRFADPRHGWAFGPELWATDDGGSTWRQETLPSGSQGGVVALETARGAAHAVVLGAGDTTFRIVSSAVGTGTWSTSPTALDVGAGPVPSVQLVLSGTGGWILQNDRVVVNGARLANGAWSAWKPACADVEGPAFIAASTSSNLAAACDVGAWSTPAGTRLYVSTDGGLKIVVRGAKVPVQSTLGIASPEVRTIAVAGNAGDRQVIEATFDGGATWARVLDLAALMPVDLGFTTPSQGVVIGVDPSGAASANAFYMTRDGGHAWSQVRFAP